VGGSVVGAWAAAEARRERRAAARMEARDAWRAMKMVAAKIFMLLIVCGYL
jgi:hypothetical protein